MKYIKAAGIAWGLIYFAIGAIFSLTLGSVDFWSGAIVYLTLFLLPLPVAVAAVWFPRTAGAALITCAAISVTASAIAVISSGPAPTFAGLCKFTMYHVPHLVFAVAYIKAGQVSKSADSGGERPSAGVA